MKKEHEILTVGCICGDYTHRVSFSYDKKVSDPSVMIYVTTASDTLWYRIKDALSYIFNNKFISCEVLFCRKDVKKIQKLINNYLAK